jgi:hypothetical protein
LWDDHISPAVDVSGGHMQDEWPDDLSCSHEVIAPTTDEHSDVVDIEVEGAWVVLDKT